MGLTIQLPDDLEAACEREARRAGVAPAEYVARLVAQAVGLPPAGRRSAFGKSAHLAGGSTEFASRKKDEITLEDRAEMPSVRHPFLRTSHADL